MKKLFLFIQGLFVYSFLAFPAFAVTPVSVNPCEGNLAGIAKTLCDIGGKNTPNTIQNIVVFLIVLAVIIALLYLLFGGIKWITSHGEKTEVEAARNHIIAAVTGLIVVFFAVLIVSIVLAAFGLGLTNLEIPTIIPK